MISRRNIRIKVMQSIYAVQSTAIVEDDKAVFSTSVVSQYERLLKDFETTVYYFTFFWVGFFEYIHRKQEQLNRYKSLPSSAFEKFYTSDFFQEFLKTPFVKAAKNKVTPEIDPERMNTMYRKMFELIAENETYRTYFMTDSMLKETELIKLLWERVVEDSPLWVAFVEEYIPYAENDEGILVSIVDDIFAVAPQKQGGNPMIEASKKQFGMSLIETTLDKWQYVGNVIKEKTQNWDESRITQIDAIILKMGATEILYYDEIPDKVSINEYVDIAKMYSGKKAGIFINGILDAISKQK